MGVCAHRDCHQDWAVYATPLDPSQGTPRPRRYQCEESPTGRARANRQCHAVPIILGRAHGSPGLPPCPERLQLRATPPHRRGPAFAVKWPPCRGARGRVNPSHMPPTDVLAFSIGEKRCAAVSRLFSSASPAYHPPPPLLCLTAMQRHEHRRRPPSSSPLQLPPERGYSAAACRRASTLRPGQAR